ncbi:MAG: hypothetical protein AAFU79_18655, partial [Myxococcota bacterium]
RVGPSGILPHRRYGGGAILAALALWTLYGGEYPLERRERPIRGWSAGAMLACNDGDLGGPVGRASGRSVVAVGRP